MPKDLDEWRFHAGRVYDFESIKEPYVVSLIESLDFETKLPVVIDVGGGSCSIVHSARLPFRRHFLTATVDIGVSDCPEYANPLLKCDIETLVGEEDTTAMGALARFLQTSTKGEDPRVDLVVYSEILNYIDFRGVMRWFDNLLKPGGFTVVANLPTRGYQDLFSDRGVKTNEQLIDYMNRELGHDLVELRYPWGAKEGDEGFLVVATQKQNGL